MRHFGDEVIIQFQQTRTSKHCALLSRMWEVVCPRFHHLQSWRLQSEMHSCCLNSSKSSWIVFLTETAQINFNYLWYDHGDYQACLRTIRHHDSPFIVTEKITSKLPIVNLILIFFWMWDSKMIDQVYHSVHHFLDHRKILVKIAKTLFKFNFFI